MLARKLIILGISLFIWDSFLQSFAAVCVLIISVVVQLQVKPFELASLNLLEVGALGSLLLTQLSGILLWYKQQPDKNDFLQPLQYALTGLLFFVNGIVLAGFLFVIAWAWLKEKSTALVQWMPWAYYVLKTAVSVEDNLHWFVAGLFCPLEYTAKRAKMRRDEWEFLIDEAKGKLWSSGARYKQTKQFMKRHKKLVRKINRVLGVKENDTSLDLHYEDSISSDDGDGSRNARRMAGEWSDGSSDNDEVGIDTFGRLRNPMANNGALGALDDDGEYSGRKKKGKLTKVRMARAKRLEAKKSRADIASLRREERKNERMLRRADSSSNFSNPMSGGSVSRYGMDDVMESGEDSSEEASRVLHGGNVREVKVASMTSNPGVHIRTVAVDDAMDEDEDEDHGASARASPTLMNNPMQQRNAKELSRTASHTSVRHERMSKRSSRRKLVGETNPMRAKTKKKNRSESRSRQSERRVPTTSNPMGAVKPQQEGTGETEQSLSPRRVRTRTNPMARANSGDTVKMKTTIERLVPSTANPMQAAKNDYARDSRQRAMDRRDRRKATVAAAKAKRALRLNGGTAAAVASPAPKVKATKKRVIGAPEQRLLDRLERRKETIKNTKAKRAERALVAADVEAFPKETAALAALTKKQNAIEARAAAVAARTDLTASQKKAMGRREHRKNIRHGKDLAAATEARAARLQAAARGDKQPSPAPELPDDDSCY